MGQREETGTAMKKSNGVLLLGDPRLRQKSEVIKDANDDSVQGAQVRLSQLLADFREEHGFGRAIAAPQIGAPIRMITCNLGDGVFHLINPEITWRSKEKITLWDDCMSFPALLVRVGRHRSISMKFQDENGDLIMWEKLPVDQSELFQHEIDHLDGILSVDRALDGESLVLKDIFDEHQEYLESQVTYLPRMAEKLPQPIE